MPSQSDVKELVAWLEDTLTTALNDGVSIQTNVSDVGGGWWYVRFYGTVSARDLRWLKGDGYAFRSAVGTILRAFGSRTYDIETWVKFNS